MLLYNQAVMGRPWRMPFTISGNLDRFGFGRRASFVLPHTGTGGQINYTVDEALAAVWHTLLALPRFIVAVPIVGTAALLVAVVRRSQWQARLLVAMTMSMFIGYFFWWGTANAVHFGLVETLGPFYHTPCSSLSSYSRHGVSSRSFVPSACVSCSLLLVCRGGRRVRPRLPKRSASGELTSAAAALTHAPGRRLVFQVPGFPNDPYISIANRSDLGGDRVVALDVPGTRLKVVDQFPDRDAYLIRVYRRLDDLFGPQVTDRVPLKVVCVPLSTAPVRAGTAPRSPTCESVRGSGAVGPVRVASCCDHPTSRRTAPRPQSRLGVVPARRLPRRT